MFPLLIKFYLLFKTYNLPYTHICCLASVYFGPCHQVYYIYFKAKEMYFVIIVIIIIKYLGTLYFDGPI